MNNGPIGVFDSGLGGLSVWRELRKTLPGESLLYYGDGLRCPYGGRPLETIREYTDQAVGWLLGEGAKMIVVACNTATAAAIEYLRGKFPQTPFVGMEPAVKPAALSTESGVVAILATEASLKGDLYRRTAERYGAGVRVIPAAGDGFVELVEENREDSPEAYETVRRVIEPLIEAGADRIVLGCTHYPFLTEVIMRVVGDRGVEIIDSAPAVARRVEQLLREKGLEADGADAPSFRFHTLAGEDYLARLIRKSEAVERG